MLDFNPHTATSIAMCVHGCNRILYSTRFLDRIIKIVMCQTYLMHCATCVPYHHKIQGGSNMTGTDLYVNKPHCAAAVRP